MDVFDFLARSAHVATALAAVLLISVVGRRIAVRLRQPAVIGEITLGLLSGPAAISLLGQDTFDALLPRSVLHVLKLIAQAGLVLFLVGLAHKLRIGPARPPRRSTVWVSVGALVPPLLSGLLLAGWVLLTDDSTARGSAPLPAFLLMVAVAMSITAVPVMARILTDRGMSESAAGRLALAAAIVIDGVGWLLLTAAIGAGSGSLAGTLDSARALVVGALCALAIRYGLRTRTAQGLCATLPRTAAALLGAAALGVALAMEHLGMTAILGAALVGLSIPGDENAPWARAVSRVSRAGRALVPAFMVVTGITVLNGVFSSAPWGLIAVAVLLGCAGKGLGGYFGARLAGESRRTAQQVAVLMNTRGLTELIVLQAGYSAGLLTAPMVLALVVMALTTTAMTGPLLNLLGDEESRVRVAEVPAQTGSSAR
ncbi:cation:proton antiporter [Streptomyces sp. NPDC054841]